VSNVDFPTYASTAAVLSALDANQLDWAGNFISGLSPSFTSGAGHAVWFAPVNTNSLIPNLRAWPMNQLAVRLAVSDAIDRTDISMTGESGLEPPATNASGIVLPSFASQEAAAVAGDTLSASSNAAAADQVLKSAGYTLDGNGYYALNGKEVDITITDPSNYTDYASDDTIMAANLKAAHINATFDGLADTAWTNALADGQFGSATSHWSNSAITLWGLYDGWLDSALNNGQGAGDIEGLDDPAVDGELATLAGASTPAQVKTDAAPLEEYVAANLPVIPTVYGASFDEYNTRAFTGWPDANNAYESGSPNTPTNEVIVLHLKPVK
jgi:peptide/nickel transport system substrate-binding protein